MLQFFVPLQTAIQIGADEGFNLSKAVLLMKGYRLYTDVWSDQPPFHTFVITQLLEHVSGSVLTARVVTVGWGVVLLVSVFLVCVRVSGLFTAAVAVALLIFSPGFLELSASCMLELPALGPSMAGMAVLVAAPRWRLHLREMVAGVLFGIAFATKLNAGILFMLGMFVIFVIHFASAREKQPASLKASLKQSVVSGLVLAISVAVTFLAIDLAIDRGAFLKHFHQTWSSHVAPAKSFEYGSAADHPFDWTVPLKNWDTLIPSLVGVGVILVSVRRRILLAIPLAWLALEFAVFGSYEPWWSYYYIHTAIPLCWCAAIGVHSAYDYLRQQRSVALYAVCGIFALGAAAWMGARVYLQIADIRDGPQTYNSLVLEEMERFKPHTKFLYSDDLIYSFHSGIPLPPNLAVLSLKRLWSGDMTNARIASEMRAVKPELVLLRNDGTERPFGDLLFAEYQLVYEDPDYRLYATRPVARAARY